LDSGPGSFYPSCELYLLICEQVGWGEDGGLSEYLHKKYPEEALNIDDTNSNDVAEHYDYIM
jgi:hypothetical protein